jgi:hypothetical protein
MAESQEQSFINSRIKQEAANGTYQSTQAGAAIKG